MKYEANMVAHGEQFLTFVLVLHAITIHSEMDFFVYSCSLTDLFVNGACRNVVVVTLETASTFFTFLLYCGLIYAHSVVISSVSDGHLYAITLNPTFFCVSFERAIQRSF